MPELIMERLDAMAGDVIDLQRDLVAIPALGPDNGGDGERKKADYLLKHLRALGVPEIRELNAPDDRVSCGHRPNILARIPGKDASRTLWVISHIDVVPPGDAKHWASNPFELLVEGDIIKGRGVEDNHAGIVPSLILAAAIMESGVTPAMNLGLLLVSDEETGSGYGLGYVVREHGEIFGPDDLIVVPDFGLPDSSMIEVAEKSILWLRFEVTGVQCHASSPGDGVNAMVAGSALALLLNEELPRRFPAKDPLFNPNESTFTPTKREANVPNINTMPGSDVFYLDCRVLPAYPLSKIKESVTELCGRIEAKYGVAISISEFQREEAAPPTPADSEVVQSLAAGVKAVYGTEPVPMGMGGGTVAAYLRQAGLKAAVWSTIQNNPHQPNERALVSTQVKDAKVLAHVLMAQGD